MQHDEVKSRLEDVFLPDQVGVGSKDGATAVAFAVRTLAHECVHDWGRAVLKIDFKNAFNKVSRQAFLEQVELEFPGLARWARWCYAQPARLWAGKVQLESAAGVQQGDPLGPLLFSLVLRKVTRQLQQQLRAQDKTLDLNAWYLDDGTLVGQRAVLAAVLLELDSPWVKALGLELNMSKCEVWWPTGDQSFPEFPSAVKRMPCMGVDILKIPVGTDEYVATRLADVLEEGQRVLDKLPLIGDAQVEFTLLRSCLGACKFMFRLRGAPLGEHSLEVVRQADSKLRRAFELVLDAQVPSAAWAQAGFRTSEGGMGLRHMEDVARPAYLAAVLSAAPLVVRLLQRETWTVPDVASVVDTYADSLDEERLREVKPWLEDVRDGNLKATTRETCPTRPQAFLQAPADATRWKALEAEETRRKHKDRLEAVRRNHAGAVWSVFPCHVLGLSMATKQFRAAARYWLGLPVYPGVPDSGTGALLKQGSDQIGRHDQIRDVLYFAARAAGYNPWRERGVDPSRARPGDVYLPRWSGGKHLAADVTVAHPSQANLTTSSARSGESASVRAAVSAADDKVRKHGSRCEARGVEFLPLAVCAFGGWLSEGEAFVDLLAAGIAERTGVHKGVACMQLWQRLSVTLWRANANAILHHAPQPDLGSWDLPGYVRAR